MRHSLNAILSLLKSIDGVILVDVFNDDIKTYDTIKQSQYIPYIKQLVDTENGFGYKFYESFSLHYYYFSKDIQIIIIGRFSKSMNDIIMKVFQTLNAPEDTGFDVTIFKHIFNAIPEFVAYKNVDGVFEYVTEDVNQLYSKTFDSIVGKHIRDVYSPQNVENVLLLDHEAYTKKTPVQRTIEVETNHGTKTFDSLRLPLFDSFNNPKGIISISRDISQETSIKNELKTINEIQSVMIDIASSFINLHFDDFDNVINESLEKIGQAIQADRVYIFEYHFEQNKMTNTFEWCNTGINPEIDALQNVSITDYLEDWVLYHTKNENVIISYVEALNHDSNLYQILSKQHIQSLITMPIFIEEKCYGFIGFDSVVHQRSWEDYPYILEIIPKLYGSLINRFDVITKYKKAEANLLKSQQLSTNILTATHEQLSSPLTHLKTLLSDASLFKDKTLYKTINTQLETMTDTVHNILDLSRVDTRELVYHSEQFSLEELVVGIINKHLHNDIVIDFNYDYTIPQLFRADQDKIRQIMNNLITHQLNFTKDDNLSIDISLKTFVNPYAEISCQLTGLNTSLNLDSVKRIVDAFYQEINSTKHLPFVIAQRLLEFLQSSLTVTLKDTVMTYQFDLTLYTLKPQPFTKINQKVGLIHLSNTSNLFPQQLLSATFQTTKLIDFDHVNVSVDTLDRLFVYSTEPIMFTEQLQRLSQIVPNTLNTILLYNKDNWLYHTNNIIVFDEHIQLPLTKIKLVHKFQKTMSNRSQKDSFNDGDILIIDDNQTQYHLLKKQLEKLGYHVVAAQSGYEGIEHMKHTSFQIVLIDYQMPGIDGIETLKQVKQLNVSQTTLYIALVGNNDSAQPFDEAGFNYIIQKPINIKHLLRLFHNNPKEPHQQLSNVTSEPLFDQASFINQYPSHHIQHNMIELLVDDYPVLKDRLDHLITTKDINSLEVYAKDLLKLTKQLETTKLNLMLTSLLNHIDKSDYHLTLNSMQELYQCLIDTFSVLKQFTEVKK